MKSRIMYIERKGDGISGPTQDAPQNQTESKPAIAAEVVESGAVERLE